MNRADGNKGLPGFLDEQDSANSLSGNDPQRTDDAAPDVEDDEDVETLTDDDAFGEAECDDGDVTANGDDDCGDSDDDEFYDHAEGDDENATFGEGDFDSDEFDDEDHDDDDDDDDDVAPEPRRSRSSRTRTRRSRRTAAPQTSGGGLATGFGIVLLIGGIGLGFAAAAQQNVAQFGLTPTTLIVLGGVALGVGSVRRGLGKLHQGMLDSQEQSASELEAQVSEVVEQLEQRATPDLPQEGLTGDVQHVLLALQKQDEKTNNLTKAIKMYGKPLMDIANHGTELAAALAQLKTEVETHGENAKKAWTHIDKQVRASGGEAALEKLGKFEVAIQALSQRLEESAKTLIRVEEAAGKSNEQLQQLSRGESVEAAAKSLADQLDQATNNLQGSMSDLRDGNLGELDTTVRGIQRDVATVATAVSQIQAAIKSGATARPAPTSAPAAAANGGASAPAPSAPAPAAVGGGGGDGEESAGYSTGKRRSGGKNVLGAIAKLKQMKG